MNRLIIKILPGAILLMLLAAPVCSAQPSSSRNPDKALFGKSAGRHRTAKVKEPKAAAKAKRQQEKNQKKLKKDYAESVDKSRKRTYDIQSPEVQARMKQNQKDTELRDKAKRKKHRADPGGVRKKYN